MADLVEPSWTTVTTVCQDIKSDQFLKAVDIWNSNPQYVNQRVHSCVVMFHGKMAANIQDLHLINKISALKIDLSEVNSKWYQDLFEELGLTCTSNAMTTVQVYIKKLLPRSTKHLSTLELVIIDDKKMEALFFGFPVQQEISLVPKFPYKLVFKSNISLEVLDNQDTSDSSLHWLKSNLLPRLQKWALTPKTKDDYDCSDVGLSFKSHRLISIEKYTEVYQTLKMKYGQQLVKTWPECTDPAKFVYEDVAIASYILLLWGDKKPISFVDLGCGNGLLVHILNSEGHDGVGIDVRRRKIWDMYPPSTKLRVQTITPSDNSLFPDTEWLIGNHSDELTPWIPVIAARSSQSCKFFVLPCCPFDFDGFKFRRRNSVISQYSDFLMYLKEVSEKCGFKTDIDRMRIPSTKRVCLVGQDRTYALGEWDSINCAINQVIEDGCRLKVEETKDRDGSAGFNRWVSDFKPREATEKVRNCTQVGNDLINEIASLTANHLLVKRRPIPHPVHADKLWNAGGVATLGEIIPLIAADKLKQLKKECGGLQTLLKNNHQVFLVEKGTVRLRTPITLSDTTSNKKIRVKCKPCWFFNNHPDGCLLEDLKCAFKH